MILALKSMPQILARYLTIASATTVFLVATNATQAASYQEWLLFPQVDFSSRSGTTHPTSPKKRELTPSVDIVYSSGRNEIKWLAEFFSSEEKTEFERLQVGWSPNNDTTIWLGRFHNPLGFWNSVAQHGAYMQTAITRPHIIEYEHDGGALPSHLSGLFAQFSYPTERGVLSYDLALGYGPELSTKLEALDILSTGSTKNDLGATIRLSYQPQIYTSKKIGLFASKVTIPVRGSIYQEVEQTILGITSIWGWQSIEMIGGIYHLNNQLTGANNNSESSFTSSYIQFDHAWRPAWAAYLRLENTSFKDGDPYLQWFPDMQQESPAIGLRHELTFNQALKFEIRRGTHLDDNYTEFNFQWSAFFP